MPRRQRTPPQTALKPIAEVRGVRQALAMVAGFQIEAPCWLASGVERAPLMAFWRRAAAAGPDFGLADDGLDPCRNVPRAGRHGNQYGRASPTARAGPPPRPGPVAPVPSSPRCKSPPAAGPEAVLRRGGSPWSCRSPAGPSTRCSSAPFPSAAIVPLGSLKGQSRTVSPGRDIAEADVAGHRGSGPWAGRPRLAWLRKGNSDLGEF